MREFLVRNEEATGSIPVSSTMFPKAFEKSGMALLTVRNWGSGDLVEKPELTRSQEGG